MTLTPPDLAGDTNERAMRLLGSFARLQTFIDDVLATNFLMNRAPESAKLLCKLAIKRIRDEDRAQLCVAIAADLGSDAEMDTFTNYFADVKQLRDRIAHSPFVRGTPDGLLVFSELMGGKSETISNPAVDKMIMTCEWLIAQVIYVIYSSDIVKAIHLGDTEMRPVKPSRNPDDWDGATFMQRN